METILLRLKGIDETCSLLLTSRCSCERYPFAHLLRQVRIPQDENLQPAKQSVSGHVSQPSLRMAEVLKSNNNKYHDMTIDTATGTKTVIGFHG